MTKAFSYLRVSGLGQVDGDGFPRQREKVQAYAAANAFEIVQEFRDEGVSGKLEIADRPGLSELMVALASNGVRTVLIERSDRLARQLMVSELILEEFRKMEVKVVTVDVGVDLTDDDDPTKVLFRQFLAAIAQWEKTNLVKKLAAARKRMRDNGERCDGALPFGEKDGEKAVIDRMVSLRKAGNTPARIAQLLNEEKAVTRFNGKWHRTSVIRVLKRQNEGSGCYSKDLLAGRVNVTPDVE
jgi:DNA invertase Pin-like site-specific DNA recombinase